MIVLGAAVIGGTFFCPYSKSVIIIFQIKLLKLGNVIFFSYLVLSGLEHKKP
jgi:hypothetical protein